MELRSFVTAGLDWPIRDVCCQPNRTCAGKADAFLLPGLPQVGWSAPSHGGEQLAASTTAYIASAARPRDDGPANVDMLVRAIESARSVLELNRSHTVVVFDGLRGKPGVTQKMRERFASKIRRVRKDVPANVDVCRRRTRPPNTEQELMAAHPN